MLRAAKAPCTECKVSRLRPINPPFLSVFANKTLNHNTAHAKSTQSQKHEMANNLEPTPHHPKHPPIGSQDPIVSLTPTHQ
jgi:hypothetical protein